MLTLKNPFRGHQKTTRESKSTGILLFLLVFIPWINGCSGWWGQPVEVHYDSVATRLLMDRVMAANVDLNAFTGTGKVIVNAEGTQRTYSRAAWVGAEPGRLRFAFRSPAGLPVFSMSCDETWVAALNHTDGKYYRRKIGSNSMSRLLPVEVKCADLYGLMVGRPPRIEFDSVQMDPRFKEDTGIISLLLKRRFRGTVAKIGIDRETGVLRNVELLDISGKRLYLARLGTMQTFDGYRLPVKIKLAGPSGSLELDVKRIDPGATVTNELFRIQPPRKN